MDTAFRLEIASGRTTRMGTGKAFNEDLILPPKPPIRVETKLSDYPQATNLEKMAKA